MQKSNFGCHIGDKTYFSETSFDIASNDSQDLPPRPPERPRYQGHSLATLAGVDDWFSALVDGDEQLMEIDSNPSKNSNSELATPIERSFLRNVPTHRPIRLRPVRPDRPIILPPQNPVNPQEQEALLYRLGQNSVLNQNNSAVFEEYEYAYPLKEESRLESPLVEDPSSSVPLAIRDGGHGCNTGSDEVDFGEWLGLDKLRGDGHFEETLIEAVESGSGVPRLSEAQRAHLERQVLQAIEANDCHNAYHSSSHTIQSSDDELAHEIVMQSIEFDNNSDANRSSLDTYQHSDDEQAHEVVLQSIEADENSDAVQSASQSPQCLENGRVHEWAQSIDNDANQATLETAEYDAVLPAVVLGDYPLNQLDPERLARGVETIMKHIARRNATRAAPLQLDRPGTEGQEDGGNDFVQQSGLLSHPFQPDLPVAEEEVEGNDIVMQSSPPCNPFQTESPASGKEVEGNDIVMQSDFTSDSLEPDHHSEQKALESAFNADHHGIDEETWIHIHYWNLHRQHTQQTADQYPEWVNAMEQTGAREFDVSRYRLPADIAPNVQSPLLQPVPAIWTPAEEVGPDVEVEVDGQVAYDALQQGLADPDVGPDVELDVETQVAYGTLQQRLQDRDGFHRDILSGMFDGAMIEYVSLEEFMASLHENYKPQPIEPPLGGDQCNQQLINHEARIQAEIRNMGFSENRRNHNMARDMAMMANFHASFQLAPFDEVAPLYEQAALLSQDATRCDHEAPPLDTEAWDIGFGEHRRNHIRARNIAASVDEPASLDEQATLGFQLDEATPLYEQAVLFDQATLVHQGTLPLDAEGNGFAKHRRDHIRARNITAGVEFALLGKEARDGQDGHHRLTNEEFLVAGRYFLAQRAAAIAGAALPEGAFHGPPNGLDISMEVKTWLAQEHEKHMGSNQKSSCQPANPSMPPCSRVRELIEDLDYDPLSKVGEYFFPQREEREVKRRRRVLQTTQDFIFPIEPESPYSPSRQAPLLTDCLTDYAMEDGEFDALVDNSDFLNDFGEAYATPTRSDGIENASDNFLMRHPSTANMNRDMDVNESSVDGPSASPKKILALEFEIEGGSSGQILGHASAPMDTSTSLATMKMQMTENMDVDALPAIGPLTSSELLSSDGYERQVVLTLKSSPPFVSVCTSSSTLSNDAAQVALDSSPSKETETSAQAIREPEPELPTMPMETTPHNSNALLDSAADPSCVPTSAMTFTTAVENLSDDGSSMVLDNSDDKIPLIKASKVHPAPAVDPLAPAAATASPPAPAPTPGPIAKPGRGLGLKSTYKKEPWQDKSAKVLPNTVLQLQREPTGDAHSLQGPIMSTHWSSLGDSSRDNQVRRIQASSARTLPQQNHYHNAPPQGSALHNSLSIMPFQTSQPPYGYPVSHGMNSGFSLQHQNMQMTQPHLPLNSMLYAPTSGYSVMNPSEVANHVSIRGTGNGGGRGNNPGGRGRSHAGRGSRGASVTTGNKQRDDSGPIRKFKPLTNSLSSRPYRGNNTLLSSPDDSFSQDMAFDSSPTPQPKQHRRPEIVGANRRPRTKKGQQPVSSPAKQLLSLPPEPTVPSLNATMACYSSPAANPASIQQDCSPKQQEREHVIVVFANAENIHTASVTLSNAAEREHRDNIEISVDYDQQHGRMLKVSGPTQSNVRGWVNGHVPLGKIAKNWIS